MAQRRSTRNTGRRNVTSKKEDQDEEIVNIVEVTGQAQDFFEKYQTLILSVLGGIALLVGAYLGYKYLYIAPKEKAAIEAIYQAETQFAKDSFALALENPGGGFEGFLDIIDNYSGTATANTAKFYAGISYLNLGKFESAVEYLSDYSPKDEITPAMKFGALGDAHSELGDLEKGMGFYQKAADYEDNDLISPYYLNKIAKLHLVMGKNAEALSTFRKIKEKYPLSNQVLDAEKYISSLTD